MGKILRAIILIGVLSLIVILAGFVEVAYNGNQSEGSFDDQAYYLGLVRGCDNGCLQAAQIDYNLSDTLYFEDFENTSYPECTKWCQENYGVKDES